MHQNILMNLDFFQNQLLVLISFLNVSYLIRIGKHIAMRTSWYVVPIIIFPFLTSIYKNTFFSFLLNPNFTNTTFNNFDRLFKAWFSGSAESLFLIGLLFIVEKISLYKLSSSVLFELWLICIGSFIFISKNLDINNYWILICGLLLPLLIHTIKSNSNLGFSHNSLNFEGFLKFFNKRNFVRILSGCLFIIFMFASNNKNIEFSLISFTHVARILIFMSIFLCLLIYFKAFNKKLAISYGPVLLLYSLFSLASISNPYIFSYDSLYKLNCITSIAFLPLVEYLYVLIHGLRNGIKYNPFNNKNFLISIKIVIGIISFCYASYVLLSS